MKTIEGIDVNWNEKLWRYCTPERFEWIVNNSRLYFASANQFPDPFEGAVAVQLNAPPPDPRYAEMEFGEQAYFQLKRLTKLNCWHRAEYESDAMWKLYAGESKGVAICSTPDRMYRTLLLQHPVLIDCPIHQQLGRCLSYYRIAGILRYVEEGQRERRPPLMPSGVNCRVEFAFDT